ncbi:hypothetical protein OSB04_022645 [Centaurea solstitialis]|uniref:Uncharacterized protein n=1 Tax=Centaurea solstitialis TaxID=347529 RepID=A0AA38W659_9ASTR|nr:hypothetical protein OSB04_022645 [Centaurea solstitialis]
MPPPPTNVRQNSQLSSQTQGQNPTKTTMINPPLNTRKPASIRWFNRVYTLVYAIAIFALVFHHSRNLISSPSLTTAVLLIADLVLAWLWATWQALNLNPVHRQVFPENLPKVATESEYPELDVFICTTDPFREPPVRVVNTVLSVMAYEYPAEKLSVYVSDDGGSQLTLFALMEGAKFAKHWLPYCKKYNILDRSPEVYFGNGKDPLLMQEGYEIKAMYESMKARIERVVERGTVSPDQITNERWIKAFNKWVPGFTPQNHPSIVEVLLENVEDKDIIDNSLPNLIYISREKDEATQIRVSGVLTNAPIVLVLDCDTYSTTRKRHSMHYAITWILMWIQILHLFNFLNASMTSTKTTLMVRNICLWFEQLL